MNLRPIVSIRLSPLFATELIKSSKLKARESDPHFELNAKGDTKIGNHFGSNHISLDIKGLPDDILKVTPGADGRVAVFGRDSKSPVVVGENSGCALLGLGKINETPLDRSDSHTLTSDKATIKIHTKEGTSLSFELLLKKATG